MAADKEQIRDRSDIVEIIGTYVPLKKRGRNFIGLCPFHQEKTPSFHVDPITRSYKCFGCGQSGDVFAFIERYENMSFVEAAEFLARRAGLTFERKGAGAGAAPTSERDRLYEINAEALSWFRRMYARVQVARDYIQKRGLAHETVERFQLGYAPDSWDGLVGFFQANRRDLRTAATAGLVHPGKSGDYYDVFRHRILFPIHDEQERVVGFGGRAFGDEQPKYLNTGETPLFAKSRLLYGLPFARRKIASEGRTLLMEGYMDVIAAHQAGFTNAVATLGTSLTEEHAKKLARLAPVVVLVYDGDNAGIKATLRASEILEKESVEVRVVRLPASDDPDSMLRRGDIAGFQQLIDNALGRVEYQLERIIANADQGSDAGRAKMLRQIVAILASVSTRAERDAYIERVWRYHPMSARSYAMAVDHLHQDAEAYAARQRGERPKAASSPEAAPAPPPGAPGPREGGFRRRESASEGGGYRRKQGSEDGGYRAGEGERAPYRAGKPGEYRRGERPRPIEPPPPVADGLTTEQRAERELMRALAEPEWRAVVLKTVRASDLLTPIGRRFYELVSEHHASLGEDEARLIRLLDATGDAEFSATVCQHLQEFHAFMANVPITDALIADCAATLQRYRLERRLRELAQALQSETESHAVRENLEEYQRILKELKGSTGSQESGSA